MLNVGENLVNIVVALLLVGPLGILRPRPRPLRPAYAAAAIAAVIVLGSRVGRPLVSELTGTLWRVGLAALLAARRSPGW